jgi:hypothetical protein
MEPKMLAIFMMRGLYLYSLYALRQLPEGMQAKIDPTAFFNLASFLIDGVQGPVKHWTKAPQLHAQRTSSCPGSSEEVVNAGANSGGVLPAVANDQDIQSDILWDWVAQRHENKLVIPSYWLDVVALPDKDLSAKVYFAGHLKPKWCE